MNDDLILQTIEKKFPFFNDQEKNLICELVLTSKDQDQSFLEVKANFLKILYQDLVRFYAWDTDQAERTALRKRFLCVSGLFALIPITELRELARKARLTLKKVVYETPTKPEIKIGAEWHSYDIKYLPEFEPVLSKIPFADDMTVLDYIAGSREKRLYPPTSFTVVMNNLNDEVIADEFITATAEPLTQTQIISLTNDKNEPRDLISLGYDMVFESAFIDFYYHAKNITPTLLLRNAHVMGLFFLKSAILKARECINEKGFINSFPVFSFAPERNSHEGAIDLINYFNEQFIPSLEKKITAWNLELDLDPDNDLIFWLEDVS